MKSRICVKVVREAQAVNACLCLQSSAQAEAVLRDAHRAQVDPLFMDVHIAREQDIKDYIADGNNFDLVDFKKVTEPHSI